MPEAYEHWQFVFPLFVREFATGKGRHVETWICVVVNRRIGGRCAVVISCWNFLILLGMARPLRAAYPFILSIKPRFRTCALHRYRCRQEGGSEASNTVECVFDAIRHGPHACSLSRYNSDKPAGYAPRIDAAPEEYGGSGVRGGYGAEEVFFAIFAFPSLV